MAVELSIPTLDEIKSTRQKIAPYILETPVWQWQTQSIQQMMGADTAVFLKLELFQHTGTFKPRGALANMLAITPEQLQRGVTAISAGNHAIAVSYAADILGTSAKVVMMQNANPARVDLCREYGAEVELMPDVHQAFERVHQIEEEEKRFFVHPFEGLQTTLGTATVGLELCHQVPELDAVIVPIGGGGLSAGVATAVKLIQPNCRVYGVEPEGADTMHRSFASGQVESIDKVRTIADSLGAPYTAPYSLALCRQFIDELVMISDDALRASMQLLFSGMKLAVEPAGAAATAALIGPLKEKLRGKRVAIIVCGTNIDLQTFYQQVSGRQ
ncbi:MAG: threonine/serine dehydratase [Ardenticatenaceae bacterium]|nr:threonine/serine dehydratase [Ardenticatenaceae bacterium]